MMRTRGTLAVTAAAAATAAAVAALLLAASSPTEAAPAPAVLALNVGADDPTTYISGAPTGVYASAGSIAGTSRPGIYTSSRYAKNGGAFTYTLPLPAGAYTVTLHWAEVWSGAFSPGSRVFDVAVGGVTVEAGLDVYVAAKGQRTALVRSYPAIVAEGAGGLPVTFTSVVQNAFICAIEVHLQSGADEVDAEDHAADVNEVLEVLRLNVGGSTVADYSPDTPYVTNLAATRTWSTATMVSTNEDAYAAPAAVYATQRWGNELIYNFPLPAGAYTLRLHFAELYEPVAVVGGRVFSITADGGGALVTDTNFDVYVSSGFATAISRTLSVVVVGTDGLRLTLKSSVQHAALQGIELMAAAVGAPTTPPDVC